MVPPENVPVLLSESDLPAACPNPSMPLWSAHPKVYLEFKQGLAQCPYCGTQYKLPSGATSNH